MYYTLYYIYGKGVTCQPSAISRPNNFQTLQPGYSEGSDHTLQDPKRRLYLFIDEILKLLLASESDCSSGE
jgi:hypothetical protein